MAEPPKPRWGGAELFWTKEGFEEDQRRRVGASLDIVKHGEGLYETWTKLALQKPPEDIIGRIIWSLGVMGQLVISIFTFPAALGAFLLEEAVQTYGMGAYMLSTAKQYESLDVYIDGWKNFIEAATTGAKSLATISPMTGGAVLIYMEAAKVSAAAFEAANDANTLK